MKLFATALLCISAVAWVSPRQWSFTTQVISRKPIVVELFTSEGCSSCPPADALLAKLERDQPVEGAEIIVLGEHVDYWDRLGWRDRFSSHDFTKRQELYADRFNIDSAYTPQMVVAGASEFNGADSSEARSAIKSSEAHASSNVALAIANDRAHVTVSAAPKNAEVFLAITESGLTNNVLRGENTGRTLTHTGVVRSLRSLGRVAADGNFAADSELRFEKDWNRANLAAVVFVQKSGLREIVGAARQALR
jgi:hypothetical protein